MYSPDLEEFYATISFKNNIALRPLSVDIPYTNENIEEIAKCKADPIYFIENYVKVIHPDFGMVLMELYDYQKRMVDAYHNNKQVVTMASRQLGKCCSINTNVRVKSKSTGIIREMTLGELYDELEQRQINCN